MGRNKPLIIVLIVVLAAGVIAGVIALTGNKDNTNTSNTMSMPDESQQTNKDQQADTQKPVPTNTVAIKDFAFSPAAVTVKVGDSVTWTNRDSVEHTVTADNGEGPDSQLLAQGESYSYTFTKAGTFNYHCQPHQYMKATVIVTE